MNLPKKPKKVKPKKPKKVLFDLKVMNINHIRFCELYVRNKKLFGNGTLCYALAYGYDLESLSSEAVYTEPDENGIKEKIEDSPLDKARKVCGVESNRLLGYPRVNEYINKLLRELMTEENADAELTWVMNQREDLSPKIQALREFNKLKGRIIDKKELDFKGLNLKELYGYGEKK